uniref:Claudin n=1 Tax=Skeletonema marinoi TaxID=267567 RepID=A0A7S2KX59_9STRA|mmetsp:Transcript_17344/g.29296  ORF Transcript_17344/g.29296 Transcript_17344/m.29296 type:complete len:267 (+) Transcript_17344:69-869(+)
MGCKPPPTFMLPGVLAIIASILCLFGGTWCKFISFTEVNNSTDPVTLSYGIWNYLGYSTRNTISGEQVMMESCNYYPDNSVIIDTEWRSARAFSALTIIIGGLVTFWLVLSWCMRGFSGDRGKSLFRCAGMMYMLCCLFQGLTLLLMTSNACYNNGMVELSATALQNSLINFSGEFPTTCTMAGGGKATIAAVVMWFLAALASLKVEPPQRDPITVETHDITYTKNQQADGTQVVTETVVKGTPVPVAAANNNETVEEGAAADQAV